MFSASIAAPCPPKGSKRHVGNGRLIEASKKVAPFMKLATTELLNAPQRPKQMLAGPVRVSIICTYQRGKSHYKADGVRLRAGAPTFPGKNIGDADKHARSCLDALVAARWLADDSQVVDVRCRKHFGVRDLTSIVVEEMEL